MSNQFLKLRRSAVPGKIPDTGSLDLGEIALNTYDGLAFMKKSVGGTESIVVIGNTTGSFSGSFIGQFTGSLLGTSSWAYNAVTASTADDFYIRGNVTGSNALFTGTVTAQTLVVQTVSSSVIYSSGSNIFGDELTDTQQFTGSVTITGSLTVNGPSTFDGRVTANNLTGSLFGTASWAGNAISSSNATTASFALRGNGPFTGSFTGSFFGNGAGLTNISASSVVGLNLSLISSGSVTASTDPIYGFRVNASSQLSGSQQITGSLGVTGSVSISGSVGNVFSANIDTMTFTGSLYQTGSIILTGSLSVFGGGITGSLFGTSSWAVSASHAPTSLTASYAISSSNAQTASLAILAPAYTTTASFNEFSSSYLIDSASWNNSISLLSQSFLQTSQSLNASIQQLSSSFLAFSQSYNTGSFTGSFNGQATLTGSFTGDFSGLFSGSFTGSVANIDGQTNFIAKFDSPNSVDSSVIYQSASHIAINETNFTTNDPEALYVFQTHPTSINVITGKGNHNNYLQLNIQNTNQGISASSDIVATANNGNEFSNYIDMGINSQNFNTGFIGGANDAYVYSIANNLHIGNAATNGTHLGFFVGGDDVEANMKLQLNPDNRHIMSGSLSLTGSLNVLEGITGSLFGTSSYAVSASYALSSSLAANSVLFNGTSSGVFATTGSNTFIGTQTITGSNGRLIYTGTTPGAYPTLAEIHANNDYPWLERFYNDTFSTSSAIMAYFGWNDGRFVFHNESTQSIGLQVNGFNAENGLLVYSDKVAFVNNVEVTGSLNVVGGITGSLYGTASWAENALTSSYVLNAVSSSYAATASSADSFLIRQNVTASNALITGTLTAQTIIAQYITSSTEFVTGSTKFGTQLTDTHQFTGSVTITGSLSLNNDPVVTQTPYNTFSSSIALRATNLESTASVLTTASASFALVSSSYSEASQSLSTRTTNLESTASILTTASASFAIVSASYASASGSLSIRTTNLETTASVLTTASASFALVSASYSQFSQSYNTGSFTGSFTGVGNLTGSLFGTASWALNAVTASNALTASFVPTSSLTGNFFIQGGNSFGTQALLGTNDNQNLAFETSGSVRMFISSSGAIGINTTIPSASLSLDVNGNARIATNLTIQSGDIIFGAANRFIATSGAPLDTIFTSTVRSLQTLRSSGGTNGITFTNNSPTNTMRIWDNGNVLIQTGGTYTDSGFKLDVSGSTRIQNTLTVTGSLNAPNITGSLFGTASWAQNAVTSSYILNAVSASFATTASYVLQAVSASFATNAATASSADDFLIRQNATASNLLVNNTITAQTLVVQTITSSVDFVTGSTRFGTQLTNTHQFTGSVTITGSLSVNDSPVITDSTFTPFSSSVSTRLVTLENASASFASDSGSNSIRLTNLESTASVLTSASASFAEQSGSNSIRLTNLESTASILTTASASFAIVSSSYAIASESLSIRTTNLELTASVLTTASASFALVSSSYSAFSQSYNTGSFTGSFTGVGNLTGSLFGTASWALNAVTASNALTASFVPTSSLTGNFFVQGGNSFGTQALLGTNDNQNLAFETSGSVRMLISGSNGFVGIGTSSPLARLDISGSVPATASIGRAVLVQNNISAVANNDTLVGLDVQPTYTAGAFTGVASIDLRTRNAGVVIGSSYGFGANYGYANDGIFQIKDVGSSGNLGGTFTTQIVLRQAGNAGSQNSNYWGFIEQNTSGMLVTSGRYTGGLYLRAGGVGSPADLYLQTSNTQTSLFIKGTSQNVLVNTTTDSGFKLDVAASGVSGSFRSIGTSVISGSLLVTGSQIITGSLNVSAGITGSLFGTSSWALNATTASFVLNAVSASFAATASSADNFVIRQNATASNLLVNNTITAQTLVVQTITSSVDFVTGSTRFGTQLTNTHQFTGSVTITGSLALNNDPVVTQTPYNAFSSSIQSRVTTLENASASFSTRVTNLESTASILTTASASFALVSSSYSAFSQSYNTGSFTGSFTGVLIGTASWAQNAVTSSYVLQAVSASFATTASYVLNAVSSSFASTASFVLQAVSSSFATSASFAQTASFVLNAVSASFAATASSVNTLVQPVIISGSLTIVTGSGIELQVTNTGVTIGNASTDVHNVTGSFNITGSLNIVGNQTITGSLAISSSLFAYQQNPSVATGSFQTIASVATGSYRCAFFDYVAFSGSVTRAGTVTSTWGGSAVEWFETYTNDVNGSTSVVTLQAGLSGGSIQLQAGISGSAWTVRSLVRLL